VKEVGILRLGGIITLAIIISANGAFADIGAPWYAYVLLNPVLVFVALAFFTEAQR
jgi:hypothetical protein